MKKVFSTSAMVAHVWAQRNQTEGRTGTSNMYFNSDAIFSYGSHFPLAKFLNDDTVLINTDGYSVSTSKHKQEVRGALRSGLNKLHTNTAIIKHLVSYHSWLARGETNGRKTLIELVTDTVSRLIVQQAKIAAKRRKPELVESDINVALQFYQDQLDLLAFYKLKMPAAVTKLAETLKSNLAGVVASNEKQLKAAAKKRDKERKAEFERRNALAKVALVKWRLGEALEYGERDNLYSFLSDTALRVNGEQIETTKGAAFPVSHGALAFKAIIKAKTRGETWQRNGHTIHLGNFQIDTITPEGNVIAGCHTVLYSEIEAIAKQLNLI